MSHEHRRVLVGGEACQHVIDVVKSSVFALSTTGGCLSERLEHKKRRSLRGTCDPGGSPFALASGQS